MKEQKSRRKNKAEMSAQQSISYRAGGLYMFTHKNGVLLRNRKAENRPLMEVICSLLLLASCLSALMISCCEYFIIIINHDFQGFLFV